MAEPDLRLDLESDELDRFFQKGGTAVMDRLEGAAADHGREFENRMKRNVLSGPTGVDSVRTRSGDLSRSLTSKIFGRGSLNTLGVAVIFTGAPGRTYAFVQEKGATITPKRGRFLAFPFPGGPAETAGGVARYSSPRQVSDLFFIATGAGRGLLVKENAGTIEPWFVLADKVIIPPRLFFLKKWTRAIPRFRKRAILAIRKAFEDVVRG